MAAEVTTFLVRLYPPGFGRPDPGSLIYADLQVLGDGLDASWGSRDLLMLETLPSTADEELGAWETVYGLYRPLADVAKRQARLAAARRFLPNANPGTYSAILASACEEAVAWTIIEPGAFRCDDADSLCDTTDDVVDGQFLWWAQADRNNADAEGVDRDMVADLVDRMAQGHVLGQVRFSGDFLCDDPYSLCDTDLLST